MFKLLRHELNGSYKIILITCIALVLMNTFAVVNIKWEEVLTAGKTITLKGGANLDTISAISLLCAILMNFLSLILGLIFGMRVLFKDLSSDSGSLLFALPQKGYSIVGAKLVSAATGFLIYLSIILIFLTFHIIQIINTANYSATKAVYILDDIIYIALLTLIGYIYLITLSYLSITICKLIFQAKRFSKLISIAIFLVIFKIFNIFETQVKINFPYYIEFQKISLENTATASITQTNITWLIVELLLIVAMFLITSYMIENKMELK